MSGEQQQQAQPESGALQHHLQHRSQQQQEAQPSSPVAAGRELLRVASVGHDCNLCMWDFALAPVDQPRSPHRLR